VHSRVISQFRAIMTLMALALAIVVPYPSATRAAVQPESLHTLVEKLQQHYQETRSFSAHFAETLTSPGAPARERSGKIYFLKPGRIRWEFDPPQPETIVSDGTTLFDYDPGLNQVVETPLKDAFKSRSAFAFILGAGNLEKDFEIERVPATSSDGLEYLLLTPKDGGDKIELGLDKLSLDILSLRVMDALGDSTSLKFADIERNLPLDLSLFKFNPPPGADIINPSRR
jgi:outer membrane lipoprotein carrier protein